jgi:hypothetical protein
MYPDYPHHHDTGVLTTNSTLPDFAFLAECEDNFEASITKHQDDLKSLTQAHSCSDGLIGRTPWTTKFPCLNKLAPGPQFPNPPTRT